MSSVSISLLHLASRSQRRRDLLRQLGLRFTVLPVDVLEVRQPGQSPEEYAVQMAHAKAAAAVDRIGPDALVLGADTDVVLDGEILGKPASREQAIEMLLRLSGRSHQVLSAVAVQRGERVETALSVTAVEFSRISPAAAAAYWETGEPADKAGAYAIQGFAACFVRRLAGSYTGVVGLPLHETAVLLERFGVTILPVADAAMTEHAP